MTHNEEQDAAGVATGGEQVEGRDEWMNVLCSSEVAWHSHSEHGQGWAMIQASVFCHQSTTQEESLLISKSGYQR